MRLDFCQAAFFALFVIIFSIQKLEFTLWCRAYGTRPRAREIIEFRACVYVGVGVAAALVVQITARCALVYAFHTFLLLIRKFCSLHNMHLNVLYSQNN